MPIYEGDRNIYSLSDYVKQGDFSKPTEFITLAHEKDGITPIEKDYGIGKFPRAISTKA